MLLVLQQVQSQILKRCLRSISVNHFHSLVKHWQNCFLQILLIRQVLHRVPFFVSHIFIVVFFLRLRQGIFFAVNLVIAVSFNHFNLLDEVVAFENSSMGLNFDYIYILAVFVRNLFLSDGISDIYDTVVALVGTIIEKYVKSAVVCLVNQHQLGLIAFLVILFPVVFVVLNGHRIEFLQSLKDVLILFDRSGKDLYLFSFILNIFVQRKLILHFLKI